MSWQIWWPNPVSLLWESKIKRSLAFFFKESRVIIVGLNCSSSILPISCPNNDLANVLSYFCLFVPQSRKGFSVRGEGSPGTGSLILGFLHTVFKNNPPAEEHWGINTATIWGPQSVSSWEGWFHPSPQNDLCFYSPGRFADNNREAALVIKEISAAWLHDFTGIRETLTVCDDVCCLVRKHGRAWWAQMTSADRTSKQRAAGDLKVCIRLFSFIRIASEHLFGLWLDLPPTT